MTSFKDVKAGDRVRLTRDNGDDLTFTVSTASEHRITGAADNDFYRAEGWNVKILHTPLPTREYAVIGHSKPNEKGWVPYIRQGGKWWIVEPQESLLFPADAAEIQKMIKENGFKVLYEGIQP